MKKLNKDDKYKLFGMCCTLVAGLWILWMTDISSSNIWLHIKFIYSIFIALAIAISAYLIIIKKEDIKKNVKRK